MNCHAAQNALFEDRDDQLAPNQQAALETHLATCGECQRVRQSLETALSSWRHQNTTVAIPDSQREWHAVRRRIRGGVDESGQATSRHRRGLFAWVSIPVSAAAAALAVALYVGPFSLKSPESAASLAQTARVNPATPEPSASNMVFVDDKSGWLVVWSSESNLKPL